MDADQLSRIQDSGVRLRCGGVTGLVAGFREAGGSIQWLRLRDENGTEHEVGGEPELVDEVDDDKVGQVRAARAAEDPAALTAAR